MHVKAFVCRDRSPLLCPQAITLRWTSSIWCLLETSRCAACPPTTSRMTLTGTPSSNPVPERKEWCRQNERGANGGRVFVLEQEGWTWGVCMPVTEGRLERDTWKIVQVLFIMTWKRLLCSWCFYETKTNKQKKILLWRQSHLLGHLSDRFYTCPRGKWFMFMSNVSQPTAFLQARSIAKLSPLLFNCYSVIFE